METPTDIRPGHELVALALRLDADADAEFQCGACRRGFWIAADRLEGLAGRFHRCPHCDALARLPEFARA